jgi:hypothetical protein
MRLKMRTMIQHLGAGALALCAGIAQAHPGHGEALPVHWHAGEVALWTLGLAAVGIAAWWLRRK